MVAQAKHADLKTTYYTTICTTIQKLLIVVIRSLFPIQGWLKFLTKLFSFSTHFARLQGLFFPSLYSPSWSAMALLNFLKSSVLRVEIHVGFSCDLDIPVQVGCALGPRTGTMVWPRWYFIFQRTSITVFNDVLFLCIVHPSSRNSWQSAVHCYMN